MKNSKFVIDTFPGREFSGFSKGADWNGWACPYFSLDEGMKIVEASESGKGRYDEPSDSFIFTLDGEEESYPAIVEDGKKLYPIGNGSWIWEEKE